MHFALPPRKTLQPPVYAARNNKPPYLRRARLRTLAWVAGAALFLILLLSQLRKGTSSERTPPGTPPIVIITIFDNVPSSRYEQMIRDNRRIYASRHGKSCNAEGNLWPYSLTAQKLTLRKTRLRDLLPQHHRLQTGQPTISALLGQNPRHTPRPNPLPPQRLLLVPLPTRPNHEPLPLPPRSHPLPTPSRIPHDPQPTRCPPRQRHQNPLHPARPTHRPHPNPTPPRPLPRKLHPAPRRMGQVLPRRLVRPAIPELQLRARRRARARASDTVARDGVGEVGACAAEDYE